MFYTAAWCTSDESTFRRQLPLELLGESLKRFGSSIPFHIVLLEGIELLSAGYLRMLEEMGFTVIDYSAGFASIVAAYPNIDAQHSRYERNCLLRWLAFRELFEGHPDKPAQFWHLDSDILLHVSLDELARDTAGKTFMLQGCPVLLTVSDQGWFDIYEANLRELDRDPAGYSAAAAAEKALCRANDRMLANNSFYRNPIGHDQDLLEYLISSRRLPQDDRSVIYRSDLFFIENPLSLNVGGFDNQGEANLHFEMKEDGKILAGKKQVPFMHYQNNFARYAQVYLVLKQWHVPEGVIRMLLRYQIDEARFGTTLAFRVLSKLWFGSHPAWGRSVVMKRLSAGVNGQTPADVLNFLTLYSSFRS
ncbi:hypothetical protein [Puia dinghuensis]|uniref:Nucleotide-diphospho-sugar transferase domain-containing protein n=1 Tax=Puia dinghuensis TaxID=1792502 RepID=A0A8J2UEN8_9BACT|nr:hypothetical protein [Puia dinghuensis]GGB06296.1 hypothetical protein GCM10011511_32120 [Puia dinghuensis]